MEHKKVVIMVLHSTLESAYPPMNLSVGAASVGAEVILAFLREGTDVLRSNYIPIPSEGMGYLANAVADFGVPSLHELLQLSLDLGVRFVAVDADEVQSPYLVEHHPIHWILNQAAEADLCLHF